MDVKFYMDETGVIMLDDELVNYLNLFSSVSDFPENLKTPTVSNKVQYVNRVETGGRCAIAASHIDKGEIISYGNGSKISGPIKYSWQIEDNVHVIGPGALDHNCFNPTCVVNKETNDLVAFRDISNGELLTFNYLTTEYDMNKPFECVCGEEKCFKKIKGFKYLSMEDKIFNRNKFGIAKYLEKYIY